jgi:hypothetical protein
MFDGLQHHTLKQLAMAEDRDTRNIAIGVRSVSSMKFPQRMEEWLEWKKNQPMYQERLEYQLNKIRENNYNTLVVTPPNSPMVFEVVDSEFWLQEGWHRLMAILELIKLGEISSEQAKAYVVNVFRNSGFKKNIVYK